MAPDTGSPDQAIKDILPGAGDRSKWVGVGRAAAWLSLYLLLVSLPLLVLLLGEVPPGTEFWWDFAMALGFAAVSMMGVQFALTARFKRLTAPYGIDIVYFFHRFLAIAALGVAFAHFAIIWIFYRDQVGTINPLEAPWHMTAGRLALLFFALAVITSEWRKLLGLEYGAWRILHSVFAMAGFALAIAHVLEVGYYTQEPLKRALWLSATLAWVALAIWVRLIRPARQKQRPYRVAEVRDEGSETWTLALEPDGHRGIEKFKPGQFVWLTLRASPFAVKEHPFSISSPPQRLPRVELTIRALGDFTREIGGVRVGETAYLDGPYGIFTHHGYPAAPGFGFIVGGVGITPVIGMLRAMAEEKEQRPCWLFFANPTLDRTLFREELDVLSEKLNLTVIHIIEDPPEDWDGETGYLTKDMIVRHIPAGRSPALQWFLCGPPPMLAAAQDQLHELGVPSGRIQVEIFNL
jgi:predicted ferric reductase